MSEILAGEGDMVARVERTVDRVGSPKNTVLRKGEERYASQLADSAAQAVEELARKAMQLAESMALHQLEVRRREASEHEVVHLKGVVATAELSVEEYARTCAALSTENEEMKKQASRRETLRIKIPLANLGARCYFKMAEDFEVRDRREKGCCR
jgi:hypothetical protein